MWLADYCHTQLSSSHIGAHRSRGSCAENLQIMDLLGGSAGERVVVVANSPDPKAMLQKEC